MPVSIPGIIINVIMLIILILIIIWAVSSNRGLQLCENEASPFCLTVQCPCDNASNPPCYGYSFRVDANGTYYCSSAPDTPVDASGNPV